MHPQPARPDQRGKQALGRRPGARPLLHPPHPQPLATAPRYRHAHPRRGSPPAARTPLQHQALVPPRPHHRPPRRRPRHLPSTTPARPAPAPPRSKPPAKPSATAAAQDAATTPTSAARCRKMSVPHAILNTTPATRPDHRENPTLQNAPGRCSVKPDRWSRGQRSLRRRSQPAAEGVPFAVQRLWRSRKLLARPRSRAHRPVTHCHESGDWFFPMSLHVVTLGADDAEADPVTRGNASVAARSEALQVLHITPNFTPYQGPEVGEDIRSGSPASVQYRMGLSLRLDLSPVHRDHK